MGASAAAATGAATAGAAGGEFGFEGDGGGGDGQAAEVGAADFARHLAGNMLGTIDHFVERNDRVEAGKGHVGAGQGVAGGHDVFAQAGDFDAVGHRITNET